MRDDYVYLPGVLREIAEIAGLPAALRIAEARGGTRMHFPFRLPAGHWLRKLVGDGAAERLAVHFRTTNRGGVYLEIPLGPKGHYQQARRKTLELMRAGLSASETARRVGIHARTVKRYRSDARGGGRDAEQGDLFKG